MHLQIISALMRGKHQRSVADTYDCLKSQLQVKAGILQRVVPQMDVNGVPNNTSTEYWDSMAQGACTGRK